MKCKFSGDKIKPFMTFGKMPMANAFLSKENFKSEYFYKLEVGFNKKNYLFQINQHPKSNAIFNNKYPFFTSKSEYMKKHFKQFFNWISNNYINKKSTVLEIGSNDGTFLNFFKEANINCLGFEPSKNVADIAKKKKLKIVNNFFNLKNVKKYKGYMKKIDLICAANVICHIPNLNDLIKSIDYLLTKNGFFIFEEPYLGSMFKRKSYDQIYDAHVYMFSLHSVKKIFAKYQLELIDALPQMTHGGSMRYVISRKNRFNISKRVLKLIEKEKKEKINSIKSCIKFKKNCEKSRKEFIDKIHKIKNNGHTICAYAASAKSTTALNYCKLNSKIINYVADSTKEKIGKYTPGTHIPIVSINHFRKNFCDYTILNSWNHRKEILNKEKKYLLKGGKFISHVK